MPGFRGAGFHLHGFFFGAGTLEPNLTVAVNSTLGGLGASDGNENYTNMTVNAGVQLTLSGVPIKVANVLTFKSNSGLHAAGTNAIGSVAGGANGSQIMYGGLAGGGGVNNLAGIDGDNGSAVGAVNMGGIGGAGGDDGAFVGGGGGVDNFVNTYYGDKSKVSKDFWSMYGRVVRTSFAGGEDANGVKFPLNLGLCGGTGGGSGGSSSGGGSSGAGGSGGGLIWIAADTIIFEENVIFDLPGGDGGVASGSNAGGGGGGGGGTIILFYNELVLPVSNKPLMIVRGGTGQPGIGTGVDGLDGLPGRVILFNCGSGVATQTVGNVTLT